MRRMTLEIPQVNIIRDYLYSHCNFDSDENAFDVVVLFITCFYCVIALVMMLRQTKHEDTPPLLILRSHVLSLVVTIVTIVLIEFLLFLVALFLLKNCLVTNNGVTIKWPCTVVILVILQFESI